MAEERREAVAPVARIDEVEPEVADLIAMAGRFAAGEAPRVEPAAAPVRLAPEVRPDAGERPDGAARPRMFAEDEAGLVPPKANRALNPAILGELAGPGARKKMTRYDPSKTALTETIQFAPFKKDPLNDPPSAEYNEDFHQAAYEATLDEAKYLSKLSSSRGIALTVDDAQLPLYAAASRDVDYTKSETQLERIRKVLGVNEAIFLKTGLPRSLDGRVVYASNFWDTRVFRAEINGISECLSYEGADIDFVKSKLENMPIHVLIALVEIGLKTTNPSKFFRSVKDRALEDQVNLLNVTGKANDSKSITMGRVMRALCEFSAPLIAAWVSDPTLNLSVPEHTGLSRIERVACLSNVGRYFDANCLKGNVRKFVLACQICRAMLYAKDPSNVSASSVNRYLELSESDTKVLGLIIGPDSDYKGRWHKVLFDFCDEQGINHHVFSNKSAKATIRRLVKKGDISMFASKDEVASIAKRHKETEAAKAAGKQKVLMKLYARNAEERLANGETIDDIFA
jgi:hypothetical protein